MSSQLKSLAFAPLPKITATDPFVHRRNKLIARLRDQIELVKNPNFTLTRQKWIADEAGVKQLREQQKRVRPWWCANVILHGSFTDLVNALWSNQLDCLNRCAVTFVDDKGYGGRGYIVGRFHNGV